MKINKYGFRLIPVDEKTKKPKGKFLGNYKSDGSKIYEWKLKGRKEFYSEEEINNATALGIDHQESKVIDVDLDHPFASYYTHWLPSTLSLSSPSGEGRPTHFIYRYEGESNES
jgi:hypothetical protein